MRNRTEPRVLPRIRKTEPSADVVRNGGRGSRADAASERYLLALLSTYATLERLRKTHTHAHVISLAFARYRDLPVVPRHLAPRHPDLRAQEDALERFFENNGVARDVVDGVRRVRPWIVEESTLVS